MQIKRIIAGLLSVSLVFSSAIAFVSAEAKLPGTDVVEAFNPDNTFIISEDLTEDYYEINTYEGDIINLDIQLDPEVYDFKTFEYSSADKKTIITYDKNLICTESGEDTVHISVYSKSPFKRRNFNLKINILPDDSIPDEIRGKMEKLNESEHSDFQRKKLELLGALDADVPRINMDIITEFIETSDNFFEIGDKINNLTKVPDVKINGELTFYSYWFDDKGTEEIAVGYDYPCSIYYYRINDDGKRTIVQDLYPVKKDPVEIDQTDYDYILYKNIFGDGINYGDINFDDTVDLSDLTMMSQYILKDIELTASQIKCADVNADDEVNVQDLALLKQFVMKDDVKLGVSKGGINVAVTLVSIVDTAARDGIPADDSLEVFYKDGEYTYAFP